MKNPPVKLNDAQRSVAGVSILEMLDHLAAVTVALAVGAEHVHVVIGCDSRSVRPVIARAKKHASHVLREHGLVGRVWAKRSRALPINDRAHQLNAIRYVKRHRSKRAWIWAWGEAKPQVTYLNLRQVDNGHG